MIDTDYLQRTLSRLVQINSINPALEADGPGEGAIARYICDSLAAAGIDAHIDELGPSRANVIGRLPGSGGGRSLMLNAHMDTVGVAGMEEPFSGRVEGSRLYGRGAYDMKGSIAAMMAMAKAIRDNDAKHRGDILFSFVADEEYDSIGSADVVRKYRTDACIVTEPTELRICLGHRGFGIYELTTDGVVAHGGKQLEGVDANMKMGLVMAELSKLAADLMAKPPHPILGTASLHVPLVRGGQSLFIYSGSCTIKIERRTLPGETSEVVRAELNDILRRLSANDRTFKATLREVMWRNPCEVSKDSSVVRSMMTAMDKTGHPHEFIGHTWWEDSGLFAGAGTETVIMGPAGGGIHQSVEWVDLASVRDLSEILLRTAEDYCG